MSATIRVISAALVFLGFFLACCQCEEKPPVDPSRVAVICINNDGGLSNEQEAEPFDPDGAPMEGAQLTKANVCSAACKVLKDNNCPEHLKLPNGRNCVDNCNYIMPISNYDPFCVARAKGVEAIRKCPYVECKK